MSEFEISVKKTIENEFKPIPGYELLYSINKNGDVISIKTNKIKFSYSNKQGYKVVTLYKESKNKNLKVHRLVALAFITNEFNKKCINHKDGNKDNNNVSNLEWSTHTENNRHAWTNGLIKSRKGQDNHMYGKPGCWKGKFGEEHPLYGKPGRSGKDNGMYGKASHLKGKTGKDHPAFGRKCWKRKKVVNILTNVVYDCITEAASLNNIHPSTIGKSLNGFTKNGKWKYAD